MNGRMAIAGNISDAPSEISTAPGALLWSSVLLASSWNSGGTAQRNGTTQSNSSTSDPHQVPVRDESSAPAPSDSLPMKRPPTMAAALASINSSTVIPKLVGSPDL